MKKNINLILLYILKETIAFLLYLPELIFLKIKFKNKKVFFILNYHNFSKYNNDKLKRGSILETDYANNFEKQIHFLKKYFHFCYPEDFFQGKAKKGINILLTFDDGYKDNYDIAFPILKKNQIPTIFFVATNFLESKNFMIHDMIKYLAQEELISKEYLNISEEMYKGENNYKKDNIEELETIFYRNPPSYRLMMNLEEVKELTRNGFKIGNHTFDHDRLTFLTKKEQYKSIKMANDTLIDIGIKPNHIAYPNGLFDDNTLQNVDKLGLEFGYLVVGGYNKVNDSKLTLKRIGMNPSDSISFMLLKLFIYSTFKYGKV